MKILAHYVPEKDYIAILNGLSQETDLTVASLHNNIFDTVHLNQIDNIILPIHEYSQEFHYFIEQNHSTKNIILFLGTAQHAEIQKYCKSLEIKMIKQNFDILSQPYIVYNALYDDGVFYNSQNKRNNKTLVILSQDNNKNKKILDGHLYPNNNTPICLINNPEYDSTQNIGIAYQSDLSSMLNTYDCLIDLDDIFRLEAQACGIKNMKVLEDLSKTLETKEYHTNKPDLQNYASSFFAKNNLVSLMKG